MLRQPEHKVEGSNVEGIGGEEDHAARLKAAKTERAWCARVIYFLDRVMCACVRCVWLWAF